MKLNTRSLLSPLVVAGTLFASASAVQAQESWRVGGAVYGLQNEYAQRWSKDLESHPAIASGLVDLNIFDGRYDQSTQSAQFDNMITQQYDAAIYVPIDSNACAGVIQRALDANLPVIGSNGPCDTDLSVSYIGSDDVEAGRRVAQAVIENLPDGGGVVVFQGPVGQLGAIQRGQGIDEVLAQHSEIELLEAKTANWSRSEAFALMQNWLTAYPGQIKGVIAQNDEMGLGAIAAMKAAGIDPETIPVAGIDGVTDAIVAVSEGEMVMTIAQDSLAQAQGALDITLRHLIGSGYEPQSVIWDTYAESMPWGDGTDKLYSVPWTFITSENAADFLK
ncbi:substrate-binding domain-containing protein [Celeribacter sp.]|uniref:substrate-binding domain-containing protein n=1 Tax=Celeribacter sp. TaxID=1890673 RepID=UPI003A90CA16